MYRLTQARKSPKLTKRPEIPVGGVSRGGVGEKVAGENSKKSILDCPAIVIGGKIFFPDAFTMEEICNFITFTLVECQLVFLPVKDTNLYMQDQRLFLHMECMF